MPQPSVFDHEFCACSPLDSVCSWLTGPWLLGLLTWIAIQPHLSFLPCELLITAPPTSVGSFQRLSPRSSVESAQLGQPIGLCTLELFETLLQHYCSQVCIAFGSSCLPVTVQSGHLKWTQHILTSSPESRLERIEQALRQHAGKTFDQKALCCWKSGSLRSNNVGPLSCGISCVNLSGPTAHGGFHQRRQQRLPPRRLLLLQLRLLLRLLPALFQSPGWAIPSAYAGDPEGCDPFITDCSILYALQPHNDVFIGGGKSCVRHQPPDGPGSDFGELLLSGSGGLQPARPSKPSPYGAFAKS
ncbi:hypothetical protein L3Q82_005143 [Scortum barcoo]|uniref:Uncharacterized protein n=1 Tax=Scortum barcoo TaxID=214431 RepID=A0ACB8VEA4_9TELE|nr:hypothetical protein L3Q82_005143 [Scortum barcoo]